LPPFRLHPFPDFRIPGWAHGRLRNFPCRVAFGRRNTSRTKEAGMTIKSMNDLFLTTLRDIYSAEKQIHKTLPKMAKHARSQELKRTLEMHREQTEGQIERLEAVFEQFGASPRALRCEAMDGILTEGKEIMAEIGDNDLCDVGMIASAQAVEHYEIARYGTLIAWAERLGRADASKLLQETLEEEKETDRLLTKLAKEQINEKVAA
jgi:ferritin-like metal-binding protein YciE